MSDSTQNDWDVVEEALIALGRTDAPLEALSRLRESSEITIAGLNERIRQLEEEIRSENKWPGERKHGGWENQDRA